MALRTANAFDVESLKEAWKPLAELRRPGFSWDGASYLGVRKGLSERRGLMLHAVPLKSLLQHCPHGFPSQSQLEATLLNLEEECRGILNCEQRFTPRTAHRGADMWRVMCKHIYDLKINLCADEEPLLQDLMGM